MRKTVKARIYNGVINPLEKLEIVDGKEVTVTIVDISSGPRSDAFKQSAGGWKGSINAEKLIESIYLSRISMA